MEVLTELRVMATLTRREVFSMLPIVATTNSPDKRELQLLLESLNFGLLITGLGIWKEP